MITVTIVTIIGIFLAYVLQIRDSRTRLAQEIKKDFAELNISIIDFFRLKDDYTPIFFRNDKQDKSLDEFEKLFTEEYIKAMGRDLCLPDGNICRGGLTPAFHGLDSLLAEIMRRFPVVFAENEEFSYVPFLDENFPLNMQDYVKWSYKIKIFTGEVNNIYRKIRDMLATLINIESSSIKQHKEKTSMNPMTEVYVDDYQNRKITLYKYFFHKFYKIIGMMNVIDRKIASYEDYSLLYSRPFIQDIKHGVFIIIVFGVCIPLYMLLPWKFGFIDALYITIISVSMLLFGLVLAGQAIYEEFFKDILRPELYRKFKRLTLGQHEIELENHIKLSFILDGSEKAYDIDESPSIERRNSFELRVFPENKREILLYIIVEVNANRIVPYLTKKSILNRVSLDLGPEVVSPISIEGYPGQVQYSYPRNNPGTDEKDAICALFSYFPGAKRLSGEYEGKLESLIEVTVKTVEVSPDAMAIFRSILNSIHVSCPEKISIR